MNKNNEKEIIEYLNLKTDLNWRETSAFTRCFECKNKEQNLEIAVYKNQDIWRWTVGFIFDDSYHVRFTSPEYEEAFFAIDNLAEMIEETNFSWFASELESEIYEIKGSDISELEEVSGKKWIKSESDIAHYKCIDKKTKRQIDIYQKPCFKKDEQIMWICHFSEESNKDSPFGFKVSSFGESPTDAYENIFKILDIKANEVRPIKLKYFDNEI